ncbi:MAG TPA: glycosyltransferase family 4 protein [Pyrinomonadaceae bacterium]
MRVLIGMPDRESLGGPAACEPPFVEELRRLGVEVGEETYVYGDKLSGTGLAQRVRRVVSTARRLRRRLKADGFDVVHLNTSFDTKALLRDAVTLPRLRASGARIFLKFHGSDGALLETKNALLRRMGRMLLASADGIGVLSSEERDNFVRAGADASKVFVVKNVVERDFPERADERLAARLNLKEDVPRLLFIARFIPAKGLTDVLRACRIVGDGGREFALLCVGDGPARAEAEAEAARLGLAERVRFCGLMPESETGEFYAGSTALVFPTYHYEGFPMTVFYAAAAALPIITTRIRAAADYLREPDNCLWVEPRNPKMLADKITRLLDEPHTRAAMGQNNRVLARSFSAACVAPEYAEIYNRLLSKGQKK